MNRFFDLVVVGSGIAGCSAALAADPQQRVALVSPGSPLQTGSSWRAQGGVAVALSETDSPTLHAADTWTASRHLADLRAVKVLTEEGPERVLELLRDGLTVDRDGHGRPLFGLEAAHSCHRVIHHRDHTGRSIMEHLWGEVRSRPNVEMVGQRITCLLTGESGIGGVMLGNGAELHTPRVILASGGFAGLYQATTTGREVRGDGIVLAYQAGAVVRDLEFVQFHPTALDQETAGPLTLLTEALRGSGAVLRLEDGSRFVDELLPRDEVARAIATQRRAGRVYLDLSPVERLAERFPGAYAQLAGNHREDQWLPVRPAAHYTIGGVLTDLDGRTSVPGLYAAGEVASVGVHGANRLASNSLLEGLVFGHRAGRHAASNLRACARTQSPQVILRSLEDSLPEFRARFEEATGVVRSQRGLEEFLLWSEGRPDTVENRLGRLVAEAALARGESLGAHFRADAGTPTPRGLAAV